MGKRKKTKKKVSPNGKPFVSVCTPTYNRRHFIPFLIQNFQAQTYPKELIIFRLNYQEENSKESPLLEH